MKKVFLLIILITILCPALAWAGRSGNIEVKQGETVEIDADKLYRAIAVNPDMLDCKVASSNTLLITGKTLGITFVHFWDSDGLNTVKVKVKPKISSLSGIIPAKTSGAQPIRLTYTNYSESNTSTSESSSNGWGRNAFYHQIRLYGDTSWGNMDSLIKYEGRDDRKEMTYLSLSLKKENYSLDLGDMTVNLSDISVPYLSLQGIRYRPVIMPSLKLDTFWGAYGNEFWGKEIRGKYIDTRYITGIKGTVFSSDMLEAFGGYYDSKDYAGTYKSRVASAGGSFKISDIIKVNAEYAKGMGGTKAWTADAALQIPFTYFRAKYRNIDSNFITPSTFVSYRGIEGFFLEGGFSPHPILNIRGEYDRYKNRYPDSSSDPNYENKRYRGTVTLTVPTLRTNASYAIWKDDRMGYNNGGILDGSTLNVSQSILLANALTMLGYARYEPTKYSNLNLLPQEYENSRFTYGGIIKVFNTLSLNLEDEGNNKTYTGVTPNTKDFIKRQRAEVGLYDLRLRTSPVFITITEKYELEKSDSGTYDQKKNSTRVKLKYQPDQNLEAYADYIYTAITGIAYGDAQRNQTEFYTGMRWDMDTAFRLAQGDISGIVFLDNNGNGTLEIEDTRLEKARVFVGNKSAWTNNQGEYNLTGMLGEETVVQLDLLTIPAGLVTTTPSVVTITPKPGDRSVINFGVANNTLIQGRVFIDINHDGLMQDNEMPLSNVTVILMKGREEVTRTITDNSGNYMIRKVPAGNYYIVVDSTTLPSYTFTIPGEDRKNISLKDGDTLNISFLIEAQRAIIGRVYEDSNRNGVFDPGEAGVPDVELRIGTRKTTTDENGNYIFKNLPSGPFKVYVNYRTLPKGYRFTTKASEKVYLSPKSGNIEGVNFGVAD